MHLPAILLLAASLALCGCPALRQSASDRPASAPAAKASEPSTAPKDAPAPQAPAVLPPAASMPEKEGLYAVFTTARGTIVAELAFEDLPLTVAVFTGLAEGKIPCEGRPAGQPFFDGLTFHRVVPGFVVQGGDPLGSGEGGPGFRFPDEFSPSWKHSAAGMLAMANSGPDTNGSQFYFTLAAQDRLNYRHAVFGRVVRGLDLLPQIQPGDRMESVRIVRQGARAATFRNDAVSLLQRLADAHRLPEPPADRPSAVINASGLHLPEWWAPWTERKLWNFSQLRGHTVRLRILAKRADRSALPAEPKAWTLWYFEAEKAWDLSLPADARPAQLGGKAAGWPQEAIDATLAPARALAAGPDPRRSLDAAVTALVEALDRR